MEPTAQDKGEDSAVLPETLQTRLEEAVANFVRENPSSQKAIENVSKSIQEARQVPSSIPNLSPGCRFWKRGNVDLSRWKNVCGGLPFGAFGGKKDIMAQYDRRSGSAKNLSHSGTFNNNTFILPLLYLSLSQRRPSAASMLSAIKLDRVSRPLLAGLGRLAKLSPLVWAAALVSTSAAAVATYCEICAFSISCPGACGLAGAVFWL